MGLRSGDLDRRIKIKAIAGVLVSGDDDAVVREDAFGAAIESTSEGDAHWAKIEYGSATEGRISVAREQAVQTATVTVRKSPITTAITTDSHVLAFDDSTWDIEGATPADGSDRGKYIMITVKAQK